MVHILGLATIAATACGQRDPVLYSSASVEVHGPEDALVCDGTYAHMHDLVFRTQAALGEPFKQVTYEWDPDSFDPDQCPDQACGCGRPYYVYSKVLASDHETFHAARSNLLPMPLEEGLATMFGEWVVTGIDEAATREQLRAAMEEDSFSIDFGQYERAAHFISFLVWWQGLDKVAQLQARMSGDDYDRPFDEWRDDFTAVFGLSWPEIWDAYAGYPDCDAIKLHWPLERCGKPLAVEQTLTPNLSQPAVVRTDVGCGEPAAVGPRFNEDIVQKTIVLDIQPSIELPLWAELDSEDGSDALVVLTPACGDCTMPNSAVALSRGEPLQMGLFSGHYFMHVFTSMDYTGVVEVRLFY